jgi:hypothetical protein
VDINDKLNNRLKITGLTNNTFRPHETLKTTTVKLYNSQALPAMLCVSENWTIKARDARRITAAEMKYMRKTAGHFWTECKTNTEFTKELNITPVSHKVQE